MEVYRHAGILVDEKILQRKRILANDLNEQRRSVLYVGTVRSFAELRSH